MEMNTGNDGMLGGDMMRRILQNQRTIIEQNAKLIGYQVQQETQEKDHGKTSSQVPLFVKVSTLSMPYRQQIQYQSVALMQTQRQIANKSVGKDDTAKHTMSTYCYSHCTVHFVIQMVKFSLKYPYLGVDNTKEVYRVTSDVFSILYMLYEISA
jgi:hypothetical protein